MKKNLTEMVFILDRSGSMQGLESDSVGGFNSLIQKHKDVEGEALVSTILFDNVSEVIHDRVPINQVSQMTAEQFQVRGCTALLDAVGSAVKHISNIHKYIRDEDRPQHTVFAIMTDGMENASSQYTYDKVKSIIEEKEKQGWQFIFLGANIDAAKVGGRMGIKADHAVTFANDSQGQQLNYEALSAATMDIRFCGEFIEDKVFAKVRKYNKEKGTK